MQRQWKQGLGVLTVLTIQPFYSNLNVVIFCFDAITGVRAKLIEKFGHLIITVDNNSLGDNDTSF